MPGTRRIFAGVSGSPGSVHPLRQAAQLAHHDALLIPVPAWLPSDSRRAPWPELRQIRHDDAWQRLWDTLDATFGGLPDGIATEPDELRGTPPARCWPVWPAGTATCWSSAPGGAAACGGCGAAGPALLPGPRPLPGAGHPSPSLAQQAGHGLRGWAYRHRWARAAAQAA
jgi:hypothetical protein